MDMGVLREIPLQVLIVLLALALSACGNDESTPPGVPADSSVTSEIGLVSKEAALRTPPGLLLRLEVTKALRFDWSDVPGATTYRLLENPDGLSDFIQVGPDIDPGIETHKLIVPLYKRLNAQYALQACNSESCLTSDILHVQGHLEESVGYFKASNAASDDYFGGAVSLSGDGRTLAVGAQHEDSAATGVNGNQNDNSAVGSGAVYIFGSSLLLVGNPLFPCRFWSMLAHPINPMDGGRHWINAPSTNRFLGSQHLGLSQTLSLIKVRAKS